MQRIFSISAAILAIFVSIASLTQPAATQPHGEVMQPPLPVHPMKQLWRDIDALYDEIDQIYIYDRYCKPPKGPNIAQTQWDIDFARLQYKYLLHIFDSMHKGFEEAIKTRVTASYRDSFPKLDGLTADNRDYWARVSGMLTNASARLDALQRRLDRKREENCTRDLRQPPPPPPPPPVDWLKGLERPVVVQVELIDLPPHFCTELEKSRWILAHVNPLRIQAAENARFASYYVVDVGRRMRELDVKGIYGALTPDEQRGLKELRAEYDWAQKNLAEQDRVVQAVEALYAKAQAIPLIACDERQQIGDLSQPSYEPTGPAELPDRFCSQEQKDAFLKDAAAKKAAAERNWDKANAKVAEFADRIGKGDKSKATSDAFQAASKAAGDYYQLILSLEAVLDQARRAPVVDCRRTTGSGDSTGATGTQGGTGSTPPPPPPAPPPTKSASDTGKKYVIHVTGEFGNADPATGGFLGFEFSPSDRGVGTVKPDTDVDLRGIAAEADFQIPDSWRIVGNAPPLLSMRLETFDGDGHSSGIFAQPGMSSLLIPGFGGPGEEGFFIPYNASFSNTADWDYRTEQNVFGGDISLKHLMLTGEQDDSLGGGNWKGGVQFTLTTGVGGLHATRKERFEFEVPDYAIGGTYAFKSHVDAGYLKLGTAVDAPLASGLAGTGDFIPYVRANSEMRFYIYDAQADAQFLPTFADPQFRDLHDSGTAFGWSAGLEAGVDIPSAAMEIYLGYQHIEDGLSPVVRTPGGDEQARLRVTQQDVDVILGGVRLRF